MTPPWAVVLVLAKAPVAGLVKTRLCPPATPVQAARIAAAALLDTLDAVAAVPGVTPVVALCGDPGRAEQAAALAGSLRTMSVLSQRGITLGQRIAAAHADAAALAPGAAVLQVGMDTPQLDAGLLTRCLDALHRPGVDAVLGPATDGGWWALGLRQPSLAAALAGVPTSRPDTGARTRAALRAVGCRLAMLPELSDVDTAADAARVAADVPGGRFAAAVSGLGERVGAVG